MYNINPVEARDIAASIENVYDELRKEFTNEWAWEMTLNLFKGALA